MDVDIETEKRFRESLIRDYDSLIQDLSSAYERRGTTFGYWFNGDDGRLVIAALKAAREHALKK